MAHFVLVHGAWQDASGWSDVAARLTREGHTVAAPDLPGHGADTTPVAGQTLDAYVSAVLRAIDAAAGPVTLVGHSMGGIVISSVAEARPERLSRLVYVAAYLLQNGETIQAVSGTDADSHVPAAMRPSADWSTVAIDPSLAADLFCNGCTPEVTRTALAAMKAEATAPFGTPLALTAERFERVSRSYITTRNDRAVSPALQDRMLAALPCAPIHSMMTGHLPFLAEPAAFTAALLAITAP